MKDYGEMAMLKDSSYSKGKRRYILISIIVLLGIFSLAIWILSSQGVISGVWSTILTIAVPALAVSFTFLQWVFPSSFKEPESSTASPPAIPIFIQVPNSQPIASNAVKSEEKSSTTLQDSRKDFFISYGGSDEDRKWAEWIAWQLEAKGYSIVLPAWDFLPGVNTSKEMDKAVNEAERVILVLSSRYLKEHKNQREWLAALKQASVSKGQISKQSNILPVCIEDCTEELARIAPLVTINLFGLEEASARQKLLESLSLQRAKPTVAPSFPGNPT